MDILIWLENTKLALLVQESLWAYPIVLSFHAIGMGFLVGTIIIIDLRLLGVAKQAPVTAFAQLVYVAWAGFAINAVTGISLFLAGATTLFFNPAFQIKILLLMLGGLTAWAFRPLVFNVANDWPADGSTPTSAKILACASLTLWLGTIVSGRLIAYIMF